MDAQPWRGHELWRSRSDLGASSGIRQAAAFARAAPLEFSFRAVHRGPRCPGRQRRRRRPLIAMCSSGADVRSCTLAAVTATEWIRPESLSTPLWTFIPKYHWLPFLVWCISGSRFRLVLWLSGPLRLRPRRGGA